MPNNTPHLRIQRRNDTVATLRLDGCTAASLRAFVAELDRLGVPDTTRIPTGRDQLFGLVTFLEIAYPEPGA